VINQGQSLQYTKVKDKAIPLRSRQTLRVPGGLGSQILRQSAHEGGKVVSPTTGRLNPQEIFLVIISVKVPIHARV
jgi:hypothetical protein